MTTWKTLLSDVLLRRSLFVLACGMIGMALAALAAALSPPVYEAKATVLVASVTRGDSPAARGANALIETNDAQQKVLTLSDLATSNVVIERVIATVDLPQTPELVRERVSAQAVPQTVLVEITAEDQDAELAREIANTVALELDGYVQELNEQTPGSAAITSARLVDPALTPTQPTSPQPAIMLALGLIGGLAGGLVLTAAIARGDRSLRNEKGVERLTGLPGLGTVPRLRGRRLTPLDVATSPGAVQSFKSIRNNLLERLTHHQGAMVAVVSPGPSEGKTSLSLGLARALASDGRSVLVADGDLRDHHLTSLLKLEGRRGWADVSAGSAGRELVVEGVFESIDVLAVGVNSPRTRSQAHGEDLAFESLRAILHQVREGYDVIVVDTAGLDGCADSALIARYSDGAILAVPHGRAGPRDVTLAVETIDKVGGGVIGTVLTMAPRSARA